MNKQMQTLLQDSLVYYRGKQLKMALNTAQIALEFGLNEHAAPQDLLQANLLLARIYNTNGIYQNEPVFQQKALTFLAEANRLNDLSPEQAAEMDICLTGGIIHTSLRDFVRAESCLRKALELARSSDNLDGQVLALAYLSKLFSEKKQVAQGIAFAEEALEFLKNRVKTNHAHLWAEAYLQLSRAYIRRQDYSRSLEMSQELLQISRSTGDVEKEVLALRNIAIVCGVKSNYKIGMQYFLEALDKCEAIGYGELIAQIQINIGTLYAHLYNHEEAIQRYQTALEAHGDLLEDHTKAAVFNNLGNIYLTIDEPEKALPFFEKAYEKALQSGQQELVAHSLAQSGRSKLSLNRYPEAAGDARLSAELYKQLGNVNGYQINQLNLANLAFFEKNHPLAVALTEQAIAAAKLLKDDACEIRGYKSLSMIFKAMGDFEKSLDYQERFAEIQEEYAKTQRNRQFLDLEIRHAIREQQREIEQLTKENEYKSLLLDKSDQIARQNQELLRVNEDLRQFAYVASHDLKEPLRMIGSYTQIIQKRTEKHITEEDRQYFTFVTDGVGRMNNLLDGLLRYATIGNSSIEIEDVNLNNVVHICLANLRMRIGETNAEIFCRELPLVRGTSALLTQLFQNLVSNALKFIRPGEKPIIHIAVQTTDVEHVISVRDNGIGIPAEHRERIFEIFQRLHNRSEYEGTGIGLAICQRIAQRLNGRIWVESTKGKGTTFFVALPR